MTTIRDQNVAVVVRDKIDVSDQPLSVARADQTEELFYTMRSKGSSLGAISLRETAAQTKFQAADEQLLLENSNWTQTL